MYVTRLVNPSHPGMHRVHDSNQRPRAFHMSAARWSLFTAGFGNVLYADCLAEQARLHRSLHGGSIK